LYQVNQPKQVNQGAFMNDMINDLAKKYIKLNKQLVTAITAFSKNAPSATKEEVVEMMLSEAGLYAQTEELKAQLLELLPYTVKVAKLKSGNYILRQQGLSSFVKLTAIITPKTIAKFSMTFRSSISQATKFTTEKEAADLVEGVNFAMFGQFIDEMKSKLSA
jgi:hypothetical protein